MVENNSFGFSESISNEFNYHPQMREDFIYFFNPIGHLFKSSIGASKGALQFVARLENCLGPGTTPYSCQ